MRTFLKTILSGIGYYRLRYHVVTSLNKRLLILMYHDLSPAPGPGKPALPLSGELSSAHFEAHIRVLAETIRTMTVQQAVEEMREKGGLAQNTVAITFDDGYKSVHSLAFPILRKYGVGATVFLLTDWINGRMTLWWEDLADLVRAADLTRVEPKQLGQLLGSDNLRLPEKLGNDNLSRSRVQDRVSGALMVLEDGRKQQLLSDIGRALNADAGSPKPDKSPLTWDQIREMSNDGFEFAAHTRSHPNMSFISHEAAEAELIEGKAEIERQVGKPVTGFAYPYGYDVAGYARFSPLLKRLGYSYACTSWWGNVRADSEPYLLNRNTLPAVTTKPLIRRELFLDLAE
ncbi:MAG: polysaccharide deacetylase family protein [Candidatus Zixiibacteriota bacterium]